MKAQKRHGQASWSFLLKIGFFKIQVKDWQKRLGYA